jgi:hypothetical protein
LRKRAHRNNHRRKKTVAQRKAAYARLVASDEKVLVPGPRWQEFAEVMEQTEQAGRLGALNRLLTVP